MLNLVVFSKLFSMLRSCVKNEKINIRVDYISRNGIDLGHSNLNFDNNSKFHKYGDSPTTVIVIV